MRHRLNKSRGSHQFNRANKRTKIINIAPPPMRGGYRL